MYICTMLIHEFFRTLPLIFSIVFFFDTILYRNMISFWLLVGLIFNGLIWALINPIIKRNYPNLASRPNTKSCYYLENNKPVKAGGMPSGHCQSMAFVSVFLLLCILYTQSQVSQLVVYTAFCVAIIFIFVMMYSRAQYYRCHTWLQATSGSIIGMTTAIVLYYLVKKTLPT
jgi:membrane-associated phospholipid phosphatase